MKKGLLIRINKLNKTRKHKKWWQRAVRAMATVVVFCTTYALILPAITMEQETICGLEAHEHGQSCYARQPVYTFSCGLDAQEKVVHSHDAYCRNAQGELICLLPELEEHTHEAACYERILVCEITHTHSEECTGTEQLLICEAEDESHTHDETCYEEREILCELATKDDHVHEESCYAQGEKLICGKEEIVPHTHVEACRDEAGNLICGLPAVAVHNHTEACLAEEELEVLTCELPEHVHEDACYPQEESETQLEYLCGSGVHAHVESCYDAEGTRTCTIPEHAHEAACLVADLDLTADKETSGQWEAAFAELTLTGSRAENVLAVAETQLGYQESVKNVILEGERLKGYTRYGAKYGDPYADWNALFVRFCLDYGGVEDYPVHSGCKGWVEALEAQRLFITAGEYVPQPGNLVFFGTDLRDEQEGELTVDAVGIVAVLIPAEGEESAKMKTIQGDVDGKVDYVTWEQADTAILGYAVLPELEPESDSEPVCTVTEHIHSKTCIDEGMNIICGLIEHTHDAQCSGLLEEKPAEQPVLDTILICTDSEHTHEEDCFDSQTGELICALTEHIHTSECYALAETLLYGKLPLICTMTEHVHGEACFDAETGALLCTENEHTHTLECYAMAEASFTYEDDNVVLEVKVTSAKGLPEGMTMEVTGLSEQDLDSYETFAYANAQGELFGLTGYQIHFYANGQEVLIPDAQVTANLTILPVEYQTPQIQTFSLRSLLGMFDTQTDTASGDDTEQENENTEDKTILVTVLQQGETDISKSGTASFGSDASGETVMTLSMNTARSFALANQSVTNPQFRVQYYAHFPQMQYSSDTPTDQIALDVIDTRGSGDGTGGHLPQNGYGRNDPGTPNGVLHLLLEETGEVSDQMDAGHGKYDNHIFKVQTELTLTEVYKTSDYTYASGMNIMTVDKLHENTHYELSEVWVSSDGEATWTVYTEDILHWVKVEKDGLIFWKHQEENSSGDSYDVYEDTVTNVVEIEELHSIAFTNNPDNAEAMLISDQDTLRMVYDLVQGTQNISANMFDYDISDTEAYLKNSSTGAWIKHDSANDAVYEASWNKKVDGKIYMMTSAYGINSVDAYIGAGSSFDANKSYFAFGNQNTGVTHRYDTLNGYYINGGNSSGSQATFKTCSFGLVKGLITTAYGSTSFLDYADGIVHQALFNDEVYYGVSVPGKTTYARQRLNFSRTGDTYILTAVNGGTNELGNGISESRLNEFIVPSYAWNTTTPQFANNFWPLDGTTSDTNGDHDFEFGDKNETNDRWYYGDDASYYFPDSDDGRPHNSYFGMEFAVEFQLDGEYCGPLEYLFYGDDDMWVFLTNLDTDEVHQICDIGGVHGSVGSFTDLWDYIPKENSVGNYRLNFYYTERGATGSSCYMEFTLPDVTSVTQNIPETGSVSVEKEVSGAKVSTDETFQFLFELTGSKDKFNYEIRNANNTEASEGMISTGEIFSLEAGQEITIVGIPKGLQYTITEQLSADQLDDYSVSWTGDNSVEGNSVSGTVANGVTHSYTCVNEALGSLEVEKVVLGTPTDAVFLLDISLTDPDGEPVSGTISGAFFDAKGKTTVKLASGEKVTFTGLPVGTVFTVREQEPDGYDVRYKVDGTNTETATGTISHKTTVQVTVQNLTEYSLPATGGSGTFFFTFGGLLMTVAAIMYISKFGRKRRKGGVY